MKYLWAVLPLFLLSCTSDEKSSTTVETVVFSGTIDSAKSEVISIWADAMIGDPVELSRDTLEEGGFEFEFAVSEPGSYLIRHGRQRVGLFLHPGDSITMYAHSEDFQGTLLFDGSGAKPNNYLAEIARQEKSFNAGYEEGNIYKEDLEDFLARSTAQREMKTVLFEKRFGASSPSDKFSVYANTEINAAWAMAMANYPSYHKYYAKLDDFEVSDDYYDFMNEVPMNNEAALISGAYRGYVTGIGARTLNDMVEADSTLRDDWPSAYRMLYAELKQGEYLGGAAKDFALASQVNDYISFFGVDGVDEIYDDLKEVTDRSELLEPIAENYTRWSKLAKGEKAPNFKYASIEGPELALDDFKGKVIYVDVWATWCGPCKGEIPASKELKASFADNKDVVFMYVSVDDDQEKWEQFLEDDPEFKGVHLITGTGWKSDITDDYMIKGIPRYLLIDQDGNIVMASAPRPSSGEKIEGMIRDLLDDKLLGD